MSSITSRTRCFASSAVTPVSCAPATVRCPPPPSFSIITCTLTSSMDRADRKSFPSNSVTTTLALIPTMSRRSLAAWAPMTVGVSSPSAGHSLSAKQSR